MEDLPFDLNRNPFYLLKADYSSTSSDLAELVEDAEFDRVLDPEAVHRAQQALVTPQSRLVAELSWLPELSNAQIVKVQALLANQDVGAILDGIDYLPELAKANVIAHILSADSLTERVVDTLIRVWEKIDDDLLTDFINEKRELAKFPRAQKSQIQEALGALRGSHAKAAAASIWRLDYPGAQMNAIVEDQLAQNPSSNFLRSLVREYDTRSESHLAQIILIIDEEIEAAKQVDENLGYHVEALSSLLDRWDEVNQPVQLFEQHRGHEEGRSKQIHDKLRELSVHLANDHGRFTEAKDLSEALLRTFPELESVAASLRKDVSALEGLAEHQELSQKVKPIIQACEEAKKDPLSLRRALMQGGFRGKGKGSLAAIVAAYKQVTASTEDASLACMVIRDLAIYLNNDKGDPETAFRLLDAFIGTVGSKISNEIHTKLKDERAIVHQNWRNAQLEEKSGDLAEMSRILGEMLKYASGSHKSELTELKSKIDQKRNDKKLKWAVYVAIVGIVIFFMAQEGLNGAPNNSSDRPSTPSFSSNTSNTPTNRNVPSSNSSSPSTSTVNITPTDPYRETMPPAAQGRSLSVDQVRYCIFQGERLDYMRPLAISNVQMTRFNGLIDDYNSRCSNFQYRAGVLERVRREAASRNSQLRADAQRIVASWSGTRDQSSAVSPMSESGPTFRRYTSTDLFGGDLTQNGYRGVSILECEAICARDSKCAGYTHVHDRNWCWPKSSIAQPRSGKIGLTSAIKTY